MTQNQHQSQKAAPVASAVPTSKSHSALPDLESQDCLNQVLEKGDVLAYRVPQVKMVLVVLSSRGMTFDCSSLQNQILSAYPDALVFFQSTSGKAMGATPPSRVDLLIDFTGPRQRQGWFYARKLKRSCRVAVGRNAGLFRKGLYDRIFDEFDPKWKLPVDLLERERFAQKKVLELAGIGVIRPSETPKDRGKIVPLDLPGYKKL